jgi:hypothetical protein
MTDQEQEQEQTRKQEFKHRIDKLYAETAQEREHFKEAFERFKPNDLEDGRKWLSRRHYLANLESLKEFADRNYEGEKPRLVISTPHKKVVAEGDVEEVFFILTDPKYNQNALDNLKKGSMLPEDSKLSDYAFLFPSINEGKRRPKNYHTSEESDKKLYTESDRECRLCMLYNIMELKEGYDINDPNRRTQFTEAFERFTELFEKKFDDPKPANTVDFFTILIPIYIAATRASIKFKDHPEGDFNFTWENINKQSEVFDDKTLEDMRSILPLVASRYIKAIDHEISENRKILKNGRPRNNKEAWRTDSRV